MHGRSVLVSLVGFKMNSSRWAGPLRQVGEEGIVVKLSPSHLCNNLVVRGAFSAFVHGEHIVVVEQRGAGRSVCTETRVVEAPALPTQVSWCHFGKTHFLVVTTTVNIQVWDGHGTALLHVHVLETASDASDDTSAGQSSHCFARGIATLGTAQAQFLCAGTSSGAIVVLAHHVERGKHSFVLASANATPSSPHVGEALTALASNSTCAQLASADNDGRVVIWDASEGDHAWAQVHTFDAWRGHPCTSLEFGARFLLAAYSTGHVRIFNPAKPHILAEIAAHNRCINAIAGLVTSDTFDRCVFASVGDDTMLNVWAVDSRPETDDVEVELLNSASCVDALLVGVAFKGTDNIITSSYEATSLQVWTVDSKS